MTNRVTDPKGPVCVSLRDLLQQREGEAWTLIAGCGIDGFDTSVNACGTLLQTILQGPLSCYTLVSTIEIRGLRANDSNGGHGGEHVWALVICESRRHVRGASVEQMDSQDLLSERQAIVESLS